MNATGDGLKALLPRRAGGGQAMKWLTVGICFTLVLFWSRSGQADVIEGYHLLQSSAVRLIRSEGASDVQPASSINASQQILSHMPRTLAWVTRSVNLSEPLISQATSKMSSATANVSTGGEFSSNSVSKVPRIAGNVFISEPSDARLPLNAYPADSAGNGSVQAQSNTSQYGQGLLPCNKYGFAQIQNLTGRWVDSPKEDFNGFYTMLTDCPSWVREYDCKNPSLTGGPVIDSGRIHQEYRQIFQADQCQLRNFDARDFSQKMSQRKLIMIGDSIMRLNFYSVACFMKSEITSGYATDWGKSTIRWQGNYTTDWAERGTVPVTKQFVGDFVTSTGFQVHLRDMGTYNATLLGQVLSDFFPLSSDDVLLINWGAWYPRWNWGQNEVAWRAWQQQMDNLFLGVLAKLPLQVIWKQYTAAHYGGPTGAEVGFEGRLPGGPWRYGCDAALVGEFWYDDYIKELLQGPKCGSACARIKVLPVFEMTRQRPNAHHGSLGRGDSDGKADCRHWCNAVTDWWTILLYNMLT